MREVSFTTMKLSAGEPYLSGPFSEEGFTYDIHFKVETFSKI